MASDIEYEAALRSAFVDKRKEFIVVTGRLAEFNLGVFGYGFNQGWLIGVLDEADEQRAEFVCRLTDEGRKHFGLEATCG